jgi:hypothetical protein
MRVRKPIAEEAEDPTLQEISKQIGEKFSLEDLLPPKQQIPSTTEGKHSNFQNKFKLDLQ